jgi:hypothetical protein
VRISRSSISKNTAMEEAGGLKLVNPAHGSSLTSCVVAANWAGVRGGGLGIVGLDLVSDLVLVDVQLVNNTAAGEAGGGLLLTGPLGLLIIGGELSGNAAGAAAAIDYSSSADGTLSASMGSSDAFSAGSTGLTAAGGGMLLEGCSWAALQGVDVWGNAAPAGCGGGIAVDACGKFMLDGATVEGNVAASGGGVCVLGVPGYVSLQNSSVSSNRALLGGVWGGVGSTLSPTPEPHLSCRVPGTGGGLCLDVQGQVLVNGSTISRNQARNGGAMALGVCSDPERCALGLAGATFTNNTAVQGGGGALYFTSAVSPDQVLCGEDYNTSQAVGYAAGTSFPALSTILAAADFGSNSSSSAAAPAAAPATAAAGTGSSTAGSSTAGSSSSSSTSTSYGAAEADSGSSSTFVPGGEDGEGTVAETVSFDPTATAEPTATTVSFTTVTKGRNRKSTKGQAPTANAATTTSAADASSMRVSEAETPSGSSGGVSVELGAASADAAAAGGSSTEGFNPSAAAASTGSSGDVEVAEAGSATEPFDPVSAATVGFDPTAAATEGFHPTVISSDEATDTAAATEGFNPFAGSSSSSSSAAETEGFDPTAAAAAASASNETPAEMPAFDLSGTSSSFSMPDAASGDYDEGTVASSEGFDPTAAAADPSMFGIASVPGTADASHQQLGAASSSAQAAFQQRSARAAAAAANQQLLAESGRVVSTQQGAPAAVPNDMGTLSPRLGDATEALKVLKPPKESTYTFAVGNGLTASTTVFVNAAATAAAADAAVQSSEALSETQGQLPAAADASSMAVPVTGLVTAAAQKAGVAAAVIGNWQKAGSVRLLELLEVGAVNATQLARYWTPEGGLVQPQPQRSKDTPDFDLYSAIAAALVKQQQPAGSSSITSETGRFAAQPQARFNPYTMTCDPVQNPAACPVPRPRDAVKGAAGSSSHGKHAKDAMTAQAAAEAAAMAAGGVAVPQAAASAANPTSSGLGSVAAAAEGGVVGSAATSSKAVGSSSDGNGRRRLMEIDEAAAANEAAAAVEAAVATAAAGEESRAPASGLILQGTSQCGTFEDNTAIGAKAYGPVVTSRPAGLRVWDNSGDLNGPNPVRIATGGQVQVQIQVVDVFGGVVTSGATDYIRVRATLQNPSASSSLAGAAALPGISSSLSGSSSSVAAVGASPGVSTDGDSETDAKGVILSGLQQLSSSNGTLILSGLRLSGPPGTNTTLYLKASDPSLLPASVPVSLTSCSAGYMQLPGSCQLCPAGTYSFDPEEPRCALCPAGATCNGTVVVPVSGFWHSNPRSAQIHACSNLLACARDNVRRQQLVDWQASNFGAGLILGKPKEAAAAAVGEYMQEQCAAGYTGTLCANCVQEPAAIAANRVSHGRVAGACVACGDRRAVLGMYLAARLYDLALWAALTWLTWRAAKAWAQAVTLNPATAAATAGSLPPSSAAAASLSARMAGGAGEKGGSIGANGMVLASSDAAAAAAAAVGTSAPLQAHVSVFLDYLQMLSIISCSVASYSWPRSLQTFMTGFTFVPLGTSRWVPVECLLPAQLAYARSIVALLVTAALPLFYLGMSAGVWIAALVMGKMQRTPILALVVGTSLFYPLITMSALNAFSCTYIDSPRVGPGEVVSAPGSYWSLDPEVKCYEGQHLQLMLGFGLPVVLLVVLAWPLLLASMLWDSRFRIREQQQHPATRRRYLVRKTIKLCHQLLGIYSGFTRPKLYLWPVLVEVRKLLLCVVVVLASGSAPAVQLYVLWGLLALVLLLEWWARAKSTRALLALQLVAVGALQAVVYLAAAFTQVRGCYCWQGGVGLAVSSPVLADNRSW